MAANLEQTILDHLRQLPPEQQQEIVAFVQGLVQKRPARKTLWDKIDERIKRVSPETWERMPQDGAEQHGHYLYRAPKR